VFNRPGKARGKTERPIVGLRISNRGRISAGIAMPHTWTAKSDDELRKLALWFLTQCPGDREQCERVHRYFGEKIVWLFESHAIEASSSNARSNLRVVSDRPPASPA
jgi:hypothetical protein